MSSEPTEVASGAPAFDPFAPDFLSDPYRQYRELRERDPVHETPLGIIALFRYDDVLSVLHDSRQSVEFENATPTPLLDAMRQASPERLERRDRAMLNVDPPDHTRLRKLVQKAFTPRAIRALGPRIEELVEEALDRVEPSGEMDVIGDLAFPLPFTVISEMLGMPAGEDRDQLREWSGALVRTLDPIISPEEIEAAGRAGDAMEAYVGDVIAHKRTHPADDMLTALIQATEAGDVLDDEELRAQVLLLYIAGHETTVNLIGNGTLALLQNRTELERLRADPDLEQNAVEELLRYDSPVQFSRRVILEPVEVTGGVVLEEGTLAMVGLGAANRDPEVFGTDAESLDLTRETAPKHVSFGGGVHYCLGAALARLEGRIAIGRLIRRFPDVELAADELRWNGRINLRGLDALPVTLG